MLTEQDIMKARQARLEACRSEIQLTLKKHEFNLAAEHKLTEGLTVLAAIQFVDLHNYDAEIAQASEVKSPFVPESGTPENPEVIPAK